jgi:DNA topoisomerase-1
VVKGDSEGTPRDIIELTYKPQMPDITRQIVKENTGSNKGKLVPTSSGELIAGFLTDHFEPIVDYGFTAEVEKEFDLVANNKLERNTMLSSFYGPFHELIKNGDKIDRATVAQAREVGIDPKSGKTIYARVGKFGPLLQLGEGDDKNEKPQFAPMPRSVRIDDVTIEQALHAFELPRDVGTTDDGEPIKANVGRFGPYIQIGKLFVSIKAEDPHTITEVTARELYTAKLKAEAEKFIAEFEGGVQVLNGRYGPYITDGKKNAKIPKGTDPKKIDRDEAVKLLADAPAKSAGKRHFTRRTKK